MNLPNMKQAQKRTKDKVEIIYEPNVKETKLFALKKYFIKTYGCQMNVHDSEEIKARLENLGYSEVDTITKADLVILNTCAIRENAHDKTFGFLGRCKHQKQIDPNLIIVVAGCMSQQTSICEEIIKKHPYIDIIIGTHNLNKLTDFLIKKEEKQLIDVYSIEGNVYENVPYKRDSNIKAWVNIMYGCNNFCTYCIVPFTRGKQRSRKHEDIIKEIENLVAIGYKEVTLLGQNVNSYGIDLENEISFSLLLRLVSKTKIERIRFVTSNPWDFTSEIIDAIKECSNIMPYIHLPIQSGSNKILKQMNRKYTKEDYLSLYKMIKKNIPNCAITTDIIVGFPEEREEDFQETLDIVEKCEFDGAFTFIYSKREATIAATMKDDTTPKEKEERLQRLNNLVNAKALKNNQNYLNKIVPVLVEGISEKDPNKLFGYTDTMKLVNVIGDKSQIGNIVPVLITDAKSFSLDGEIKKEVTT